MSRTGTHEGGRSSGHAGWRRLAVVATPALLAAGSLVAPARADTPWAQRLTGYLSVRDGTQLKYSVLLPPGEGPFPAVMNYSGYDAGSIGGAAYVDGDTTMSAALDSRLLNAGYAVIGVNMAGTGCSQGQFSLFDQRWGTDGYDAVEWAAGQSWSDGAIGMANWSYAGISQVLTAIDGPPHLKAIAPGMAVTDPWRDVAFPGGVKNWRFPYGWGTFIQDRWKAAKKSAVAEGDTTCLTNLATNNAAFPAVSPTANQQARPYPEDATPAMRAYEHTSRINVPVLSMTAWQDEATGPRAGYFQDELDPKLTYLVGSNGSHDIYESDRWQALLLRFFDHYVKGVPNGFENGPHVRIWEESTTTGSRDAMGGDLASLDPGTVITRPGLPVKVRPVRYALRSDGRLTRARAAQGEQPDSYRYPRPGPAVNDLLKKTNARWKSGPARKGGTLAYTTPPLGKTLTFYGPASLDLWISSTAPDADVQATVTEVRPDGKEVYVQRGWVRLSQRALDKKRSTALRPFLALKRSTVSPIRNRKPVFARVEIQRFSHIFRRGSSIRIWLDAPSVTGSWGFSSPTRAATLKVFHQPARQSQLVLGLLLRGGVTTPRPSCDAVLMQPCRRDPLR